MRPYVGALAVIGLEVVACQGLSGLTSGVVDGGSDAEASDGDLIDGGSTDTAPPPFDSSDASTDADARSLYAAAVLADKPLVYLRFGETSGTVAHDSSGNERHGLYVGCTLGASGGPAGDPDTAASFNGTSSYVIQSSPAFDFTGQQAFTIEGWFRPRTNAISGWHQLIDHEVLDSDGGRQGYALFLTPSGNISFERYVDGNDLIAGGSAAGPPAMLNVYTHLAGTYDGADLRLYVNGILVASIPDARAGKNLPDGLYVGTTGAISSFFDGDADEVAVYGSALSATRLLAHASASQ
jgi:hypothetical protein